MESINENVRMAVKEKLKEMTGNTTDEFIENRAETLAEQPMEDCCRHKHRDEKEMKLLLNRLNRIEGQVRGVKAMVEDERYCVDILTQVTAIQAALNSFNKVLLSNHIKSCVVEDVRAGKEESLEELCETIQKLMK